MNNNDISLFEKIAFVNNIPTENDAYELSNDYPFAVIVTEQTEAGVRDGIKNNTVNKGSGNIWLGGNRLTKFINVDQVNNSISMDTYSIVLKFDQESGLLSLGTQAKVDDYELSSIFYKDSNDNLRVYIDKAAMTIANGTTIDTNNTINWNWNTISDEYSSELNDMPGSTTNYIWNIDTIDSKDNIFYMIVRFEASSYASLVSVPITSFNMLSDSQNSDISTYEIIDDCENASDFCASLIENNTDGYTVYNQSDINLIEKVTWGVPYKDLSEGGRKPALYVMYRIKVNKNIPDNTVTKSNLSFKFSTLSSYFTKGIRVNRSNTVINFINNNTDDIKLYVANEEASSNIFIMPNATKKLSLQINPKYVRNLKLYITSSNEEITTNNLSNIIGLSNGFTITDIDENSTSEYIRINKKDNTTNYSNKFEFTIKAPESFTYQNNGNNPDNTLLRFIIVKEDTIDDVLTQTIIYDSNITDTNGDKHNYNVYKCTYEGLEIPNLNWGTTDYILTSGQILYPLSTGDIFALFSNRISSSENINSNTFIKVNINDKQNSNNANDRLDISLNFKDNVNPAAQNHAVINYNTESQRISFGNEENVLPASIVVNARYTIKVPFIFKTYTDSSNLAYNNSIEWIFSYHGYDTEGNESFRKNINADKLIEININEGLQFKYNDALVTTNGIDSGLDVIIDKNLTNNETIKFKYQNGQIINAYDYVFSNLIDLKNAITIGPLNTSGISNQNVNDLSKTYLEIVNNKLTYHSDENTDENTYIYLELKYTDPNYNTNLISTDRKNILFKKIEIEWLIYVSAQKYTKSNDVYTEIPDSNYVLDDVNDTVEILSEIPTFGTGAGNKAYGLRILSSNIGAGLTKYYGGWSYLGKLVDGRLQYGSLGYNSNTASKDILSINRGESLALTTEGETQYDSWDAINYLVVLPKFLSVTDAADNNILADLGNTIIKQYNDIIINKGVYSVYLFNDIEFKFNIKINQ